MRDRGMLERANTENAHTFSHFYRNLFLINILARPVHLKIKVKDHTIILHKGSQVKGIKKGH
jgi:hypothetical protein